MCFLLKVMSQHGFPSSLVQIIWTKKFTNFKRKKKHWNGSWGSKWGQFRWEEESLCHWCHWKRRKWAKRVVTSSRSHCRFLGLGPEPSLLALGAVRLPSSPAWIPSPEQGRGVNNTQRPVCRDIKQAGSDKSMSRFTFLLCLRPPPMPYSWVIWNGYNHTI